MDHVHPRRHTAAGALPHDGAAPRLSRRRPRTTHTDRGPASAIERGRAHFSRSGGSYASDSQPPLEDADAPASRSTGADETVELSLCPASVLSSRLLSSLS